MDHRCFGRPLTSASNAHLLEPLSHVDEDLLEVLLALGSAGGHHQLNLRVALGVQRGEGEILELPAHLLHAEAVRQRRVHVEGLLGGAALLPLGHHGQGAHVVQPVGQLYQQDPPVLRHGDEHLADGRRLLCFLRVELQAVELGHAVDHGGHAVAEGRADVVEGQPGVLDGVVEQGGGDRLGVEAELGHDGRHGDGMGDVGLARAAELPLVGSGGDPAGLDDGAGVVVGPVAGELPEKGREQVVDQLRLRLRLRRGAHLGQRHHRSRLPARENKFRTPHRGSPTQRLSGDASSCACAAAVPVRLPLRGRGHGHGGCVG